MKKRNKTVRIATRDLSALNQVIRDLNNKQGSETCGVSREITRLENITARMLPAPQIAAVA